MDSLHNYRKHRQYHGFSANGKGIIIPIYRFKDRLLLCMVLWLLLPGFNQAQSYCWPNVQIACFYGDMITRVNFSNINHLENVCNNDPDGKKDFTTTVPAATVIAGNTYTLTVTLNVNSSAGARAWIDFNRNNVFEASESFFDAVIQNNAVLLSWTTASEKDNPVFNIERSEDGLSWVSLQSIKGRGNSNTRSQYDFSDHAPIQGFNYYRLKQSDDHHHTSYSNTIAVDYGTAAVDEVYPNPFQEMIIIKANNKSLPAVLYNNRGEIVPAAISYSTDHLMIDTRPLEKGLYVLRLNQHCYKLIKN